MTTSHLIGAMTLAGALLVGATAVQAAVPAAQQKALITARAPDGRATQVQINGKDYAVCSVSVQDNCINPRAAGLNFGNRALNYWPGHPSNKWDKTLG